MIIDSSLNFNSDVLYVIDKDTYIDTSAKIHSFYSHANRYFYFIPIYRHIEDVLAKGKTFTNNYNSTNVSDYIGSVQDSINDINRYETFENKVENALATVFLSRYFKKDEYYSDRFNYLLEKDPNLKVLETKNEIKNCNFKINGKDNPLSLEIIKFPGARDCEFEIRTYNKNNVKEVECGTNAELNICNNNCYPKIIGSFNYISINNIDIDKDIYIDNANRVTIDDCDTDGNNITIKNAKEIIVKTQRYYTHINEASSEILKQTKFNLESIDEITIYIPNDNAMLNNSIDNIKTKKFSAVCNFDWDKDVNICMNTIEASEFIFGAVYNPPTVNIYINKLIIPEGSQVFKFDYTPGTMRSMHCNVFIEEIEFKDNIILDLPALTNIRYKGVRLQRNKRLKDQIVRHSVIVDKINKKINKELMSKIEE